MKMWHIRLGSPFSEAILQETNIAVFSLNSESCIRETPLQQEKCKLCFSPSLDKGQQMPAELLSRVLRKRIFSTSFLWQPDEKTSVRVSFLLNRKKENSFLLEHELKIYPYSGSPLVVTEKYG